VNELVYRAAVKALGFGLGACEIAAGQVKTTVPDVVPGARPAIVERITIRGKALEGNAVDRTVLVFLPPNYARERNRRYPVRSSGARGSLAPTVPRRWNIREAHTQSRSRPASTTARPAGRIASARAAWRTRPWTLKVNF
jgi:hypothetical protein